MFGLYRQRVSADDKPLEKLPIDCALPGTGWVIFATASLPGWRYWQAGPAAQSRFVHFLPAWNISLHIGILRPRRNR